MARKFACDPQEAELVARELTRLRSDLQLSLSNPLEDATSALASDTIEAALGEFTQAVTTARTSLITAVGSAAGLFAALSEGTLDLDKAFAERATHTKL
ncbi:hypothetical protein ACIF9R_37970 [Streptomyces sp. NPDC086080]|uniref:hypothetical protein n=1 Tax=Streptomyces sp. NPDC086080 TaxID=3365748 RepID=UPI0037D3CB96